ncbi:MAG: NADPH-dependent F420 reductase [Candidatus Gerdarchaeota archaeon]|nr:MAG: NADPH-dependent F420 reductase [Candidatus Gerdarchaeota archaeon]RLI71846.1 MAG: NADPH-dependent F420 reductase [Candidatus Gerdarchaeota archaeon]
MEKITIGLIPGTGKQSRGIALRLGAAGQQVLIGSRSEEKALRVAEELNKKIGAQMFTGYSNKEVVRKSNLLFLVVPPQYLKKTLQELTSEFNKETILVDVTVPLIFKDKRLRWDISVLGVEEHFGSSSEFIQAHVPDGVIVVGAFKTISATKLNALKEPLNVATFLVSDSFEAKLTVKKVLSKILDLQILDAGPLTVANTIEHMTALVINLNKLNKIKHGSFRIVVPEK